MKKPWLAEYPPGVPDNIDAGVYPSLAAFIDARVQEFADRPAFASFGTRISYRQYADYAEALAAYLQNNLQLKKGDRVAVMLPNLLQYAVIVYAAVKLGLIIVNVNPLYSSRELRHQLNDADTDAIFIWARSTPMLADIINETGIKTIITIQIADLIDLPVADMSVDPRLGTVIHFGEALAKGRQETLRAVEVSADDLAFLQYTGGTTGLAKGAMLTQRNLVANVTQLSATFEPITVRGEEIYITALPLYHIYALTCNLFSCINCGGLNVLITDPRDLPAFVAELKKWPFTYITGVNTLYNALINTPGFADIDFSYLRVTSAGGMALQKNVAERWYELTGRNMFEGYGLSETSPVLTANPYTITTYTPSIGVPVPSTDLSIRDEQGHEVAVGESGELCARGPQVMAGYWRHEGATAEAMSEDGFFRTGDIAVMEANGYFRIIDRKKDMILISGFNVFPNEVEDVVASLDGVLECACIGVPDARSGEAVKLFVVQKPGAKLTDDSIRSWCKKHLAPYKVPSQIQYEKELPKTNVGKILRRSLREMK